MLFFLTTTKSNQEDLKSRSFSEKIFKKWRAQRFTRRVVNLLGDKKGEGNYKHEESNVHLANLAQLKVIFCASLKFISTKKN